MSTDELLDPAGALHAHGRGVRGVDVDGGDDAGAAVGQLDLVADRIRHDDGAEVAHDDGQNWVPEPSRITRTPTWGGAAGL